MSRGTQMVVKVVGRNGSEIPPFTLEFFFFFLDGGKG
jgi:hypothetical protein